MKTIARKIRQAISSSAQPAGTTTGEEHPNFWMYP